LLAHQVDAPGANSHTPVLMTPEIDLILAVSEVYLKEGPS
jgi:hypothetical protein